MRRLLPALALLFGSEYGLCQAATEVLRKNSEAQVSVEQWKTIRSMRLTGTLTTPSGDPGTNPAPPIPAVFYMKRPNLSRMDIFGQTNAAFYDGKTAWASMPGSSPRPLGRTGLARFTAATVRQISAFGRPPAEEMRTGLRLEVLGLEASGDSRLIKLEAEDPGGGIRHIFIDEKSGLLRREIFRRGSLHGDFEVEVLYGDYRRVQDMMLPYRLELRLLGSGPFSIIQIEKVEINVDFEVGGK